MATVSFKRGDNAAMNNTPISDGLLYFNTEDNKIYMDNGSTRKQYGGDTDLISDATQASDDNAFSSNGALDLFTQKTTVVDTKATALAVTSNYIPLGCLAFKETIGTNNFSNVGDGTVSGGLVSLRGETVQATLATGETSITLTSTLLNANTYIDVYTDDYLVAPTDISTNLGTKQITLTFDAQDHSVVVRVVLRNL